MRHSIPTCAATRVAGVENPVDETAITLLIPVFRCFVASCSIKGDLFDARTISALEYDEAFYAAYYTPYGNVHSRSI